MRGFSVVRCSSLRLILSAVVVGVSAQVWSQDLIIESGKEGQNNNKYQEIHGKWIDSRIPPSVAKSSAPGLSLQGSCATRKCVFSGPNIITSGPAVARFSPQFDAKGHYFVYATWPRGANASPVRYVVRYSGDTTTRKVIQNGWGAPGSECNAGTWIPIGDYDFDSGPDQYVEVNVESDVKQLEPNWYGQVYADAIRFSKTPLADLGVAMSPQAPPPWPGKEPPTVLAATPLPWKLDLTSAWQDAATHNRKLFLYFFAKDAYLDHYENNLFMDPSVQAYITSNFVPVRVDMDKDQALARKLGVFRAGTIAAYDRAGKPLGMISKPLKPEELIKELQTY